eukprot:TRINITY_DN109782_c0_g1_i1.p1 TRINITY_DN109782_c0_g1~~TRINITY_DN109782_c0_g1_i1.p1  ORF type:complete len:603 (-),score=120.97 TRINITY_DN109782_c0_g1_i1:20-1798(-)
MSSSAQLGLPQDLLLRESVDALNVQEEGKQKEVLQDVPQERGAEPQKSAKESQGLTSELLQLRSGVEDILQLQLKLLDGQQMIHFMLQSGTATGPSAEHENDANSLPSSSQHAEIDNAVLESWDVGTVPRLPSLLPKSQLEEAPKYRHKRTLHLQDFYRTLVQEQVMHLRKLFTNAQNEPTFLRRVVRSGIFELVCTLVVVANTLSMGFIADCEVAHANEIQHLVAASGADSPSLMIGACELPWLESGYFVFYCVELLLKLAAYRKSFFTGHGWSWNVFDLILVFTGALSFLHLSQINMMWFRIVRIFRQLVKVLRVFRVVRFCDELRVILISVTSSLKSFFWSLVTLALVMYICAIVMVSGVAEYLRTPAATSDDLRVQAIALANWGSVWLGMLTLYRSVTGGGPWKDVVEPLERADTFYYAMFLLYIAVLVIGLLKLLTGIFVQHAGAAASLDRDNRIRFAIEQLFHEIDSDDSGMLTMEEFESKLSDPVTVAYFEMLQIDKVDIDELFALTDVNDDKQIDVHEFIEGCQSYKGHAKKLDARYIRKQVADLTTLTETCVRGISKLNKLVSSRLQPRRISCDPKPVPHTGI